MILMNLKKRQRLVQTALLLIVGLLASANAAAYDFEKDGIYYTITSEDNRTVEVTNHGSNSVRYSGAVVIPSSVIKSGETYKVTEIGDDAFVGSLAGEDTVIYYKVSTPPEITSTIGEGRNSAFDIATVSYTTPYVPVGAKKDYEVAEWCKEFMNIEEMNFSGVAQPPLSA